MRLKKYLKEKIDIDIEVGDVILGGRFKNKRITVKSIEYNERGEPLVNGKPLMKFRLIPREITEEYLKEFVTDEEAQDFIDRWKTKLKIYGVTDFKLSKHFLLDRLNHSRNNPPISVEEMDFIMNGFIQKMSQQFRKDTENVKNHTAKRRGINKKEIPENELEFAVTSQSTKIKFVFALKQDHHKKGTAIVLPVTIIRHPQFRITKGEQVMVERRRLN